jgi:hypothetical protein
MWGTSTDRADLRDPRLAARLPARFAAEIRHRFSRWEAVTEDVGPQGCQLVTPRLVASGREIRLLLQLHALRRTVQGSATVVWSRATTPSRLGLRFLPDPEDRGWFEALLATDPILAAAAAGRPERLSPRAHLFFGQPPRLVVDFTRDELAVLRRMRQGMAVSELSATFGSSPDRLRGALFALLSRRQLVLDAKRSSSQGAWRQVLAQAEAAEVAQGLAPDRTGRPSSVQRLLDEGQAHLAAGRIALAAARFRAARDLAPEDPLIQEQLRSLGPFA